MDKLDNKSNGNFDDPDILTNIDDHQEIHVEDVQSRVFQWFSCG